MRGFIVVFFMVIALDCQLFSQIESSSISFEEIIYDFGEIQEKDGEVQYVFIFKNTGRTSVAINEIVSGCGCASSEFSKEPVTPGQKGEITITYNPFYRPGSFSKEIVVLSNNRKEINRIWIKGCVIPFNHPVEEDYPYNFGAGLHLNLKVLAFGKIAPGESKKIKLRYANDTDKPMTLSFIIDGYDSNIKFENPGKLSPKKRGELYFSYTMSKKHRGEKIIDVYPMVNGEKLLQQLQVKVFGID